MKAGFEQPDLASRSPSTGRARETGLVRSWLRGVMGSAPISTPRALDGQAGARINPVVQKIKRS